MISEACDVVSQVISRTYWGLLITYMMIANANITTAAAPTMMLFCLVVNLFHHSSIFAGISFNLSAIAALSSYVKNKNTSLDLDLHQFLVCFHHLIADGYGILQSSGSLSHSNGQVMRIVRLAQCEADLLIFGI